MTSLGLTAPLAVQEAWRLWTCHLAHWDWGHLLLNGVAAMPPLALLRGRARMHLMAWAFVAAPLVSAAILASGFRGEYRGASGLVVGMWVYGGLALLREADDRRLGAVLLLFVAAKLFLESADVWPAVSQNFETITVAHYAGVIAGLAALFKSRFNSAPVPRPMIFS